jgi:hypothetical protein
MSRILPEDTVITGELYFSLPAEPSTDTVGFTIGDDAQVMFMREWFVSAEPVFRGFNIHLQNESLFLGWFEYEDHVAASSFTPTTVVLQRDPRARLTSGGWGVGLVSS